MSESAHPLPGFSLIMKISAPGFWRRLVSMIYESLLLLAVLFIAGFIFHLVFRDTGSIFFRPAFQLYLLSQVSILPGSGLMAGKRCQCKPGNSG